MVAQDSATAWDLKPNRENTNQIFNVLCNVQPVEHPWSGEGHQRQTDIIHGSKQQYWFEKCKGLKRCKLYQYECHNTYVDLKEEKNGWETEEGEEEKKTQYIRDDGWINANFTDAITFDGYRIFLRRKNFTLAPYGERYKKIPIDGREITYVNDGGDGDPDSCDRRSSSRDARSKSIDTQITDYRKPDNDQEENTFPTADKVRIYIQQVDSQSCTGDTFDDADTAPIVLVREFESSECNPDHFIMGYGGIGVPVVLRARQADDGEIESPKITLAIITFGGKNFAYIYNIRGTVQGSNWLYIPQLGIYVNGLSKPTSNTMKVLLAAGLPDNGYFIPNISELMTVTGVPEELDENGTGVLLVTLDQGYLYSFDSYGEIPYFATQGQIRAIHGFYTRRDESCDVPEEDELYDVIDYGENREEGTPCRSTRVAPQKKRVFLFTTIVSGGSNTEVITGLEKWGARLTYIADGKFYSSGQGIMNGAFNAISGDAGRGVFQLPAGITDVKAMYGSLLFFGPKAIYAIANQEALVAGTFIDATENEDGYYSPNSFYNDDGEFLIVRRGKLLETLQFSAYYGTVQFTPDTGFFVNGHIKPLSNSIDMVNIDATVNHRYISIYDDNDFGPHYSKLLIYDKHYNCWYYWLITGARVVHVKDNIYLGDGIYVNKGRTRGWATDDTKGGEIIEIISAYVGEEGLQTPKHIQFVKTAIGDHSIITKDSKWDINTSLGGKLFERRNDITVTRYPQLLFSKNSTNTIKSYENGEQIYGHGKLLSHNLLNEIAEYRGYDKFSDTIIREMGEAIDEASKLARFASIKEPINAPTNVLQLCISARHLDNVQFGSFYVGYYLLDPDYEDIENTNIDISDASDRVDEGIVINKGEYCDEILAGSACDRPEGE